MLFSTHDIYEVATAVTATLAAAGSIGMWVRREEIASYLQNNSALRTRVLTLIKENEQLRSTLQGARQAAESWEAASQGHEAILRRLDAIESVLPKFNAALVYIRALSAHIALLESILANNKMAIPALPPVPSELLEDLDLMESKRKES